MPIAASVLWTAMKRGSSAAFPPGGDDVAHASREAKPAANHAMRFTLSSRG
jgi:hypothetical protein